ncbi:MAG: hypothetical protein ABIJ40_16420 [Bacteroidota bacterium]
MNRRQKLILLFLPIVFIILIGIFTHENYQWGNGFNGESYSLIYNKIFIYSWGSDIGLLDWAFGYKIKNNDKLVLKSLYHKNQNIKECSFPKEFYEVEWGKRKYLIETNKIIPFCNSINQGWEPRKSSFGRPYLLRNGDNKISVSNKPNIPKKYINYLLDNELYALVKEYYDSSRVILETEDKDRILEGIELFNKQPYYSCIISYIDSFQITAEVDTNFKNNVSIGDTLSTKLPFEIPEHF